jgi:hypothetical protein
MTMGSKLGGVVGNQRPQVHPFDISSFPSSITASGRVNHRCTVEVSPVTDVCGAPIRTSKRLSTPCSTVTRMRGEVIST